MKKDGCCQETSHNFEPDGDIGPLICSKCGAKQEQDAYKESEAYKREVEFWKNKLKNK